MNTSRCVLSNQKGQGLTEYLILLLLISVVSIVSVRTLGGVIQRKIVQAKDHINKDVVLDHRD